jgi:basic membrane protein A
VTVIYDPDALGDHSFNDLIYQGVEAAALKYHLRTMQLSPITREEGLAYLKTIFQQMSTQRDTIRRLFIVTSTAYDSWLRRNNSRLENNPYTDLLYLETTTPLEGKGSTLYLPYYGAMYEAGAIAPHFSSKVLLVGANPENESIAEAIKGFQDGFASDIFPINMEKQISVEYLGQHVDEGYSIPDTTAMKFLIDRHNEDSTHPILAPVCGGTGSTLYRMNQTLHYYYMMGVDVASPSTDSPFSAVKHIDRAVALCIRQWLSVEGLPKHQSLGLADGYTGVELHIVKSINTLMFNGELTDNIIQKAHEEAIRKESEK